MTVALARAWKHGLLERGERPRLDDLGRDRARQGGKHEQPDRVREREDRPGDCHDGEEGGVAPQASDSISEAGQDYRHDCRTGHEGTDHEPDLDPRQPQVGKGDR